MTVFVDAAYWIARTSPGDQWHEAAIRAIEKLEEGTRLVTTDEVLAEFLTAMSGRGVYVRRLAVNTALDILADPNVEVLQQTRESFLAGLERYSDRIDKRYSLQDCISMNVMESMGITEVLTNDHHFEQEGFTALMR